MQHAGSVCLLAGIMLCDHSSAFRSGGKVKAAHCKEVLREHTHIYIYFFFSLISFNLFSIKESSPLLVFVSNAVARHIQRIWLVRFS